MEKKVVTFKIGFKKHGKVAIKHFESFKISCLTNISSSGAKQNDK